MIKIKLNIFAILSMIVVTQCFGIPTNFVYLKKIDPTIVQDIRYAGYHNFIGSPIKEYQAAECILTRPAAEALHRVQMELKKSNLSLKVYDCYRPQQAVEEFIQWSRDSKNQIMKNEFYPRVNKKDFFRLGYVASKSGHTRGSTMDLTIVKIPLKYSNPYKPGDHLISCLAPFGKRFNDGSIDMGTGFDCMDELSHPANQSIDKTAYKNRMFLQRIMKKYGFQPYDQEWWHFTLKHEPYPNTYFNFPVTVA